MTTTAVMITLAIALPVGALSAWLLITLARVDRAFRADLQGIHFES